MGQRHLYWNLFKRRLRGDGLRTHECIIPYGMLGDLRLAAGFLKDKVEATLRGDRADKVDLVCHSAGGLVARYYMMYLDGAKNVGAIVTMGTPHQGTYFSYITPLPFLPISRQTRPGSHFLDEINGPGAIPEGVKFTNIWSPLDGVVLPSNNSKLPGSNAIRVLATHWSMLWSKEVYRHVRNTLIGEPLESKTGVNQLVSIFA